MPAPDASADLRLLEDVARAAGAIALEYYGGDYKRWSKEGGSPVTEADLAVNTFLHDRLTHARPDYGWLSEESADDPSRLSRSKVFVIDPIDGTIAFLKNRPHFTICAAVVEDGRLLGIVDRAVAAGWVGEAAAKPIGELCGNRQPRFAVVGESCRSVATRLAHERLERLPVVKDAASMELVGLVARSDLIKPSLIHFEEEEKRERLRGVLPWRAER